MGERIKYDSFELQELLPIVYRLQEDVDYNTQKIFRVMYSLDMQITEREYLDQKMSILRESLGIQQEKMGLIGRSLQYASEQADMTTQSVIKMVENAKNSVKMPQVSNDIICSMFSMMNYSWDQRG